MIMYGISIGNNTPSLDNYKNWILLKEKKDLSKYLLYLKFSAWSIHNGKIYDFLNIGDHFRDIKNNKCKLVIEDAWEGPIGEPQWKVLDFFMKEKKYPMDSVCLISGNHQIPSKKYMFTYHPVSFFHSNWAQYHSISMFNPINDKNLFLCYNRIPRLHRQILICELMKEDLFNKGIVSFRKITAENNLIKESHRHDLLDQSLFLETITPLYLDTNLEQENPVLKLNEDHHSSTFLSLVTETLTEYEVNKFSPIFFSEKTWKPISIGQPFIILASKGHLEYLKNLGYKTFNNWWSEEYDALDNVDLKISLIVKEIKKLSQLSTRQLSEMRLEMREILIHNQNVYNEYRNRMNNKNEESLYKIIKSIWESF